MLKFTSINKENPKKTDSKIRLKNFDEIYANFAKQKAEEQASKRVYYTFQDQISNS